MIVNKVLRFISKAMSNTADCISAWADRYEEIRPILAEAVENWAIDRILDAEELFASAREAMPAIMAWVRDAAQMVAGWALVAILEAVGIMVRAAEATGAVLSVASKRFISFIGGRGFDACMGFLMVYRAIAEALKASAVNAWTFRSELLSETY